MHFRKPERPRFLLPLVALLAILAIAVGFTYSWIEGGTTYTIQSDDVKQPIKTDSVPDNVTYSGKITLTPSADSTTRKITLVNYDENTNKYQDLIFSPVSSSDGENFLFPVKNNNGTTAFYREGKIDDIGTKYIKYDFDIADTTKNCYVAFNTRPTVKAVRGNYSVSDTSALRIMIKCGDDKYIFTTAATEKTSTVATNINGSTGSLKAVPFDNFINKADKTAKLFSYKKDYTGKIEVSVWLDDGSDFSELQGCEITINLDLIVIADDVTAAFNAITCNKTGTKLSNGFTGGSIQYGTTTYTESFTKTGTSFTATAVPNNNYDFMGWYSDEACSDMISDELTLLSHTPDNDVTYYAKFQERNSTTIYVEPRASYTSYSIYAYGANEYKTADGSTRIVVDKNSFNHDKPYLHIFDENANAIKAWPGTQLTNKNADGNYYVDLPASTFTEGLNYFVIVHDNGSNRIPTDVAKEHIYNLHIGYEQIFKTDKIHLGAGTSTHFTDSYPGSATTFDSNTSYYKMSFNSTEIGDFFAILTDGDEHIYPSSGLPGVKGQLGGTYLFTADNKLIEFDPADMITIKADSSSGGTATLNGSTADLKLRPGQTVTIKANNANNYEFKGWYTSSDCTKTIGTNYKTANQTITLSEDDAGKTLTYYAKFSKIPTLTLKTSVTPTGGGTASANSSTSTTVQIGSTVNLKATASDGYRFVSWYTDSDCSSTTGITNPTSSTDATYTVSGTANSTVTLYAKFEENVSGFKLRGYGGDWSNGLDMAYTDSDNKYVSVTQAISAGTFEFKIYNSNSDKWYGCNNATIYNETGSNLTLDINKSNIRFYAYGGTYTFIYDTENHSLQVVDDKTNTVVLAFNANSTTGVADASAIIYLQDLTNGNIGYRMTKIDTYVWMAEVPTNVTKITFKRNNSSNTQTWNEWSNTTRTSSKRGYETTGWGTGSWK